jgi:hypothetical protein
MERGKGDGIKGSPQATRQKTAGEAANAETKKAVQRIGIRET